MRDPTARAKEQGDLGHVFGLNHGYVYGDVAREKLSFVPNCRTMAEYMGGSFIVFPT